MYLVYCPSEQFKQVLGWKTRTTGDELLSVEDRGGPIVLERYHLRYPHDNIVKKWAVNITAGV